MIPYYRPYYDCRELAASLRPGSARDEFAAAVAARAGVRYGLAFAYGRAGLVTAFRALRIENKKVILPAYTCLVMAHAVMASNNRLAFVDIDLTDYNMDVSRLRRVISPDIGAVVATHMYGYPADVEAVRTVVGDEALIVEDCALGLHVLSAQSAGVRGDLALFSFGAGKPVSVYEGGVLVTDSSDLYERIRSYRDQSTSRIHVRAWINRWARFLASYAMFRKSIYGWIHKPKSDEAIRLKFDLPSDYLPWDAAATLPNFQARIGVVQLHKLDTILERRRVLAKLYDRELRDCSLVARPPLMDGAAYSHYTVRIQRRDESQFERLMFDRGVAVDRAYDYALPYLEPYRSFATGEYPQARQAAYEAVNLPCYPHLREVDAQYVAACVRECALKAARAL